MKKMRKYKGGVSNSILVSNVIKFIVVTCAFSISTHILIVWYLENNIQFTNQIPMFSGSTFSEVNFESSVWCNFDARDKSHKTCTFHNLCWIPSKEYFIFLLGEESILHGVEDWRDLSTLDLSSVAGHNRFLLKIAVVSTPVPAEHPLSHYKVIQENEWIYLLWRFKPDNIMHIVHDDLLPLFYAYEEKCAGDIQACVEKYKLVFADDSRHEFAFDLYQMFSSKSNINGYSNDGKPLFLKHDLKLYPNASICFTHASIGLPRTTSWFHYGFGKPQGAIEGSTISQSVLKRFTKFLRKKMEISIPGNVGGTFQGKNHLAPRALFMTRSINRQILNEMEVIDTTKNIFLQSFGNNIPLHVDYFNPAPNSSSSSGMKEMLKAIQLKPFPKLIMGMHSAALTVAATLCLGLKEEESELFILELFPLGIDPAAVSPLRALLNATEIRNSKNIFYEWWINTDPSKSFLPSHSADPLLGGGGICQRLDLSTVLPPVECCHNQDYLCRMFQNTVVDTAASFPEKLMLLLQKGKHKVPGGQTHVSSHYRNFRWYFPASVTNIHCSWNMTEDEGSLVIIWTSPINLYMHFHHYTIAVTLQYINESEAVKINDKVEVSQEVIFPEMSMDLFLKTPNTSSIFSIPKQFMNKSRSILLALTWIQCVVTMKHMEKSKFSSSLDAFHRCWVKL